MKKQRYFLCLLAALALLYYALPLLPINDGDLGSLFTFAWLTLCLLVIAGNLAALLFTERKRETKKVTLLESKKRKIRSFE